MQEDVTAPNVFCVLERVYADVMACDGHVQSRKFAIRHTLNSESFQETGVVFALFIHFQWADSVLKLHAVEYLFRVSRLYYIYNYMLHSLLRTQYSCNRRMDNRSVNCGFSARGGRSYTICIYVSLHSPPG